MASLQTQKRALRKTVASTLRGLRPAEIETESCSIIKHITNSPWFSRSRTVSCFLSMPTAEVDTSYLVSAILRAGKALFVPQMHPEKPTHMDFLQIRDELDLSALSRGLWDIREPGYTVDGVPRLNALATDPGAPPLDIIFIPGLAFDRTFARLGHGKGYYDRFLSAYGKPRPLLVALAFRQQILTSGVPMADHDWRVDIIVSPDDILTNSRGKTPSEIYT